MLVAVVLRAAALAGFLQLASSSPAVSFPINAQVPPVARIGQPFSFIFAANTFTSSSSMTYSLDNAPDWLSIDSSKRWLHGTPQDSDVATGTVVGIPASLIATDDSGSIASNMTLVVSRNDAPTVQVALSQQLSTFGTPYSMPSSLLAYPDHKLSFTFDPDTFSPSDLNYYAVSGDNSPLPSWLTFNPGKLSFSGTTPSLDSLTEPPQNFGFQLIASDVAGFSATAIAFSILVGTHELTVDDPDVVLNATIGKALVYTGFQTGVKIDGSQAGPANISATVSSDSPPPDWLTFDNSTWELSGTPPSSAQNAAFTIGFSDSLADTVNVTVQIDIADGKVFKSNLPGMQAQKGSFFSLNLTSYLRQTSGVETSVETQPEEDWLHLDQQSLILSGTVPINESASSVSVSVQANLTGTNTTESQTFLLEILSGPDSDNTTATSAVSSPTASATGVAAATGKSGNSSRRTILLAVLIPTLLLTSVLAIVVCCFCCRRRRKRAALSKQTSNQTLSGTTVTNSDVVGAKEIKAGYQPSTVQGVAAAPVSGEKAAVTETVERSGNQTHAQSLSNPPQIVVNAAEDQSPIHEQPRVTSSNYGDDASDIGIDGNIPDFPAPPLGSLSSKGSSKGSNMAMDSSGHWPFEESTLLSDEAPGSSSSHGDLSATSSQGDMTRGQARIHDSTANENSVSASTIDSRHRVASSIPLTGVIPESSSAGSHPLETVDNPEEVSGDGRSSMIVPDYSRSTINNYQSDSDLPDNQNRGMRFLGGFASKLTSRFRRPKAGTPRDCPSEYASSINTDLGSVVIGDVTTAQPYRPRPIYVSGTSRVIPEESPQSSPVRSNPAIGRASTGSRSSSTAYSVSSVLRHNVGRVPDDEESQIHGLDVQGPHEHRGSYGSGVDNNSLEWNEEGDEEWDVEGDENIRLDPPVPVFLGHVGARETTNLSEEIATSLRDRRPTSNGSGLSGISAAMEEVRSLLLLPQDQTRDTIHSRLQSTSLSSGSWVTTNSSEPNWTSLYNFVLPRRQMPRPGDPAVPPALRTAGMQPDMGREVVGLGTNSGSGGGGYAQYLPGGLPSQQQVQQNMEHNGFVFTDTASQEDMDVPGAYPESNSGSNGEVHPDEAYGVGLAVSRYSHSHIASGASNNSVSTGDVRVFI